MNLVNATKLAVIPAVAIAFLATTTSSADALRLKVPPKKRATYAKAKQKAERKIRVEFRKMDKHRNGVLNKRDFTQRTKARWMWTGKRWKRVRYKISNKYYRVLKAADFNRNGVVTFYEYRRAKLATYIAKLMPKKRKRVAPHNVRRVRDHRTVRPAPIVHPVVKVRDHRISKPAPAPAPAPTKTGGTWTWNGSWTL